MIKRDSWLCISIHALRGEGDFKTKSQYKGATQYFNPRPPWGGRLTRNVSIALSKVFQSTPSVGRATVTFHFLLALELIISIHALRGEGDTIQILYVSLLNAISIHALRGEGDRRLLKNREYTAEFQSTPSVGRATHSTTNGKLRSLISIHALRGEGDLCAFKVSARRIDFNPRPPWGGRRDR